MEKMVSTWQHLVHHRKRQSSTNLRSFCQVTQKWPTVGTFLVHSSSMLLLFGGCGILHLVFSRPKTKVSISDWFWSWNTSKSAKSERSAYYLPGPHIAICFTVPRHKMAAFYLGKCASCCFPWNKLPNSGKMVINEVFMTTESSGFMPKVSVET